VLEDDGLVRRPGRYGEEKISCSSREYNYDSLDVQAIASRYTDCDTLLNLLNIADFS
jgi:hypothetical protein